MSAPQTDTDSSRTDKLSSVYTRYADSEYRSRWSAENPGNAAIVSERERVLERLTLDWKSGAATVLDLGCGNTTVLPPVLSRSRRVGIDILFERVVRARTDDDSRVLVCGDGAALPLRSASFEAVVLSTVLSSVPEPDIRTQIASECARVLVPGGAVIWYDMRFSNPKNRHTAPLRRRDVERLFPDFEATWRSLTVLPPLACRLGESTSSLYPRLARIPLLRSHLAGVLVKPT